MDEDELFEALDESPSTNVSKPTNNYSNNYSKPNSYGNRNNTERMWDKTDFKATPVDSSKFQKSGKSFMMYGFVPYDMTVPEELVLKFTKIASHLASKGYTFRYSGSDRDVIQNAVLAIENLDKETYLGWPGCNKNIKEPTMKYGNESGYSTAMAYHSAFLKFKPASRAALAAKIHAVLGVNVNDPVDLVIAYNSTGDLVLSKDTNWKNMGDLGVLIKVCKDAAIPLFNIGNEKSSKDLMEYLKSLT